MECPSIWDLRRSTMKGVHHEKRKIGCDLQTLTVQCTRKRRCTDAYHNTQTTASTATKVFTASTTSPQRCEPRCAICAASSTNKCSCGTDFAGAADAQALTSYVNFVQCSKTPLYEEACHEEQRHLAATMIEVLPTKAYTRRNPHQWNALAFGT